MDTFVSQHATELGYQLLSSSQEEYCQNKTKYYATVSLNSKSLSKRRRSSVKDPERRGVVGVESRKSKYDVWIHDEFVNNLRIHDRKRDIFVSVLTQSVRSRAALGTLLQTTIQHPKYFNYKTWAIIWFLLGTLRDCSLLPAELVLIDMESEEMLPQQSRQDFELKVLRSTLASERVLVEGDEGFKTKFSHAKSLVEKLITQRQKFLASKMKKQNSGISGMLSFQNLGEIIFGGGEKDIDVNDSDLIFNDKAAEADAVEEWLANKANSYHHNVLCGRWDSGYEQYNTMLSDSNVQESNRSDMITIPSENSLNAGDEDALSVMEVVEGSHLVSGSSLAKLSSIRELVMVCGTGQLVTSSRYFSNESLVAFVQALIDAAELAPRSLHSEFGYAGVFVSKTSVVTVDSTLNENPLPHLNAPNKRIPYVEIASNMIHIPSMSRSTVAWFENILVDIALKNRDRLPEKLWPLICDHYRKLILDVDMSSAMSYRIERFCL